MQEAVKFLEFGLSLERHEYTSNWAPQFRRHNEVEINFVESGSCVYELSGKRIPLAAGRLTVFWGAMPHRIAEMSAPTRIDILAVPLPWYLQFDLPAKFNKAILGGRFCMEADDSRFVSDQMAFAEWISLLKIKGSLAAEARRIFTLQLEARLRLLCMSYVDTANAIRSVTPSDKISQLLELVTTKYREELSVSDLAAAVDLHPAYATTLFRKNTGMGLLSYLNHVRVTHAQRLLTTTDNKIIDIGLDSGFGSNTQFYKTFARICGCSPKQFRAQLERPL